MTIRTQLHHVARRTLGVLLVGGLSVLGSNAQALDLNDIINLQAAGLDPSTIVNVIRSDSSPLQITPAEVEQLRAAGVPQPVLDEICIRVGCNVVPGIGGPIGPGGPGGPGGFNQQEELERQRLLEEERMRQERERIEAERARMRDEILRQQERESMINASLARLDEASRMLGRGQCESAAAEFRGFLDELMPEPGSGPHYQALTGWVSAMHCAGFRQSIRRDALQAVLYGPTYEAFEEMFGILREISNEVAYLDPQFEAMTGFTVNQYSQAFQDQWNYFLGRFFWQYGEYERALQLLERLDVGAEEYAQARYLSGVMQLDLGQNRAAYASFQNAVLATEAEGTDQDINELANMAIARISFEVQQFDVALYHYNRIEAESVRHPRARYEIAWSYLRKGDWNRAIGAFHTLRSPYYDQFFWPELWVLEAFVYLQSCQLETAQDAIYRHDAEVAVMQQQLVEFIANTMGPEDYLEAITSYYQRYETANAVRLPLAAVRYVLADITFKNQRDRIEALERELGLMSGLNGALATYGADNSFDLESTLQTARIDAGLRVSQLISAFEADVRDWNVKAQELEVEITVERLSTIEGTLDAGRTSGSASTSLFVLAQDWQSWPFEGEYWADEVDNYRGDLANFRDADQRCILPADVMEGGSDAL